MISDVWVNEIVQAVHDMEDDRKIIQLIREKLGEAYDAGYEDARAEFET